jgi:hypothetical protein
MLTALIFEKESAFGLRLDQIVAEIQRIRKELLKLN